MRAERRFRGNPRRRSGGGRLAAPAAAGRAVTDLNECPCIWNPVHLNENEQIGTNWYELVRTSTSRYRIYQIGTRWYKLVHDGTRQNQILRFGTRRYMKVQNFPIGTRRYKIYPIGTSLYKMVPASTRYLKFGTRRYKQVPDFPNWYKTVQDGTSQNQIFQYKQVQEYHISYIEVYTSINWYILVRSSTY